MAAKDTVGRWGEDVAARHLVAAGLVILDRNWRCRAGEIDIVARDGRTLVFCEVKTRRGGAYGTPFEAVTDAKAHRQRRLAAEWLEIAGLSVQDVRFDVVGVLCPRRGGPQVEHRRGVI
jgi:putative endonuclease